MKLRWLPLVLAATSCSFEPTYQRPPAPIPQRWPHAPSASEFRRVSWRALFVSAELRAVVGQALQHNRDLRVAAAAIASAHAQYALARAQVFPKLELDAAARVQGNLAGQHTSQYSLQFGTAGYEIDLFGRLRSLSHAALESYLASEAGARAVRLTLIADTASAWLNVAAQRGLLAIAQQTEQSASESARLTRSRLEGGVSSELDVQQAETILAQARSDVAAYTTAEAQARHALSLFVGAEPEPTQLPADFSDAARWLSEMPSGLTSRVLLARPDVVQAEHTLKAANANIGAARAAFFPTISLTALGGLVSSALSSLFTSGAVGGTLAPQASQPIWTFGANEARLAYSRAQRDLYLASYERTIQRAFREVSDALARRSTIEAQLSAQQQLVTAASASYELSAARYRSGVSSYLNTLDAQRTLYSAKRTLLLTELSRADNLVVLYRVLGGG